MNYVGVLSTSRQLQAGSKKWVVYRNLAGGNMQWKKSVRKWQEVSSDRGTLILWYCKISDCIAIFGIQNLYSVRSLWKIRTLVLQVYHVNVSILLDL